MPSPPRPPRADPGAITRSLLADGSLAIRGSASVWPSVAAWLPRIPPAEPVPGRVRGWIEVEDGGPDFPVPAADPVLRLCSVSGWPGPAGGLLLCDGERRVSAVVEPAAGRARVRLDPPDELTEAYRVELFAGLTLAAALLLGRLERTLVHAGAVVAPDGRAWLLVGGTFSGKTTTCLNLIRAGWDYLADDHVVLAPGDGGVEVEGWPRRFNVDHGYARGVSQGMRGRVEPDGFGPGRWRRAAPLGGVLLPRVEARLPTAAEPATQGDALSALLQQSPWLLADRGAAPAVLALLKRAAQAPARRLRLGTDSYANREQLCAVLDPVVQTLYGGTQVT